ncbi:MAG TPA: hypothetical protein VE732_06535 [Nitrososphaera sp.]|jgi:hypothetical protein|nr:hypothetical protein [Nitrososphaera sp.]
MGSFREEFMRTERTLARHPAAIKERLVDAARAGIAALSCNDHEMAKMPRGLRQEFQELMAELTKAGGSPTGEGSIHGTVIGMSEGEAQMMVDRILALCYEVEHLPRSKKETD